jgi:hypothetical protein
MANNCYNTFSFFGNVKVVKQVEIWNSKLQDVASAKTNPQSDKTIFEVFFPDVVVQSAIPYLGTKWAYPDFGESIPLESGELGFVSAWSAMVGFQDHLTEVLSKLDKNVVVLLLANTDAYEEIARYTAIGTEGEIFSQSADLEFDDDDEKEDPNYTLFYEHQMDACNELIDAVPGAKLALKKHLKFLENAFDESRKG